jgi:uncharacterized protein (DUF58 family)
VATAAAPLVLAPDELARVERLAMHLDRPVSDGFAGAHRSRRRGRSLDFADWREYQPGDDPRSIDQQAWARLDQVLIRLYEADVDLSVQLVIDTSASMKLGDKFAQALRTGAAIAAMALVRNESVSVATLADRTPRRYRGRGAIPLLLRTMAGWTPAGPTPLAELARHLMVMPRRAGLLVVISDFLTPDWSAALDQLTARREQLIAIGVSSVEDDHPDLAGEVQLVDVETGHRVDVDVNPRQVAAFTQRRLDRRAALERHVLRNDGRWVHVDAADDLLGAVIPALMGTGVAR